MEKGELAGYLLGWLVVPATALMLAFILAVGNLFYSEADSEEQ